MAFTVATGDVFEVRIYSQANSQIAVNTLHVKVGSVTLPSSTEQQVADGFARHWLPLWNAVIDENANTLGVISRRLTPTKTKGRQSQVGIDAGTRAGELMPGQITALIKLETDDPGAGKDGKLYIPFVSESDSDAAGALTAGYITALGTLSGHLGVSQDYNNSVPALMFSGSTGIFRRATNSFAPITTTVVKTQWATQHRRSFAGKGDSSPF